jgi:hypothetical protein
MHSIKGVFVVLEQFSFLGSNYTYGYEIYVRIPSAENTAGIIGQCGKSL